MPFSRCPVCGELFHLNIGLPLDEWYHSYWPQVHIGDEVPGECLLCWVELRPGHRVTIRSVPEELGACVDVGTPGVITATEPGSLPVLVVALEKASVPSGRFRRSDLYYVPGQKSEAEPGATADPPRHDGFCENPR
jgi:hypothetical protein